MADVNLSKISGSNSLIELAPDLGRLSRQVNGGIVEAQNGIDATSGVVELLNEVGKYSVGLLELSGLLAADTITVVLTVNGVDIFNSTWVIPGTTLKIFSGTNSGAQVDQEFMVRDSIQLTLITTTSTNVSFTSSLRPIL